LGFGRFEVNKFSPFTLACFSDRHRVVDLEMLTITTPISTTVATISEIVASVFMMVSTKITPLMPNHPIIIKVVTFTVRSSLYKSGDINYQVNNSKTYRATNYHQD
jgi:hypothetical protein